MAFNLFDEVQEKLHPSGGLPFQYPIEVPEDVRLFLGNLGLLRDVPTHYLIPDEKYLPKVKVINAATKKEIEQGALKIFRLDTEWIACLLDGALSIGPDDAAVHQLLLTKALAGNYAAEVIFRENEAMLASQMFGNYTPEAFEMELQARLVERGIEFDSEGKPSATIAQNNWSYSGFFMRSTVLSAWTGVEVTAKGSNPNVKDADTSIRNLQVVRFEHIHDDLIFCLCEGIITQIEIKQPQEVLHFEMDINNSSQQNHRAKTGKAAGVLDILGMQNALQANDAKSFALEMLAQPLNTIINLDISYIQQA